jgi:transcriptional regulator with XRE-family HTH domain
MDIVSILKSELEKRRLKNHRYSLRRFAKFLNMDASGLSRIMREERQPTFATCLNILKSLQIDQQFSEKEIQNGLGVKKNKSVISIPFDERENAILTLSLNDTNLVQVKGILEEARTEIIKLSEKNESAESTYNICIVAYPTSKR